MLSILAIIAVFALFTPNLALTPAEIEIGKIDGFTGGDYQKGGNYHYGDFLISTFCFCTARDPVPQVPSEANYLQFEYYNSHSNKTFVISHLCRTDQDSLITCLAPRVGDGVAENSGLDWQGEMCRSWRKPFGGEWNEPKNHQTEDRMCYIPSENNKWRYNLLPGPDRLKFNGQKRRLGTSGGQGPVLWSDGMAQDKCGLYCHSQADMVVVQNNDRAQSHIVTYEDLDDMCDECH